MVELSVQREKRTPALLPSISVEKTFKLFMELFSRVPWQSALEGSMSAGEVSRSAI